MKTLLNTTKITTFFLPTKTKKSSPITTSQQMPHKKHKSTNHQKSRKIQQTLTGQHYQPTSTQTVINKQKPTYQKRQYSTITNFIEGPHKTIQHTITFLEKPVTLSDIRVPYKQEKQKIQNQLHIYPAHITTPNPNSRNVIRGSIIAQDCKVAA